MSRSPYIERTRHLHDGPIVPRVIEGPGVPSLVSVLIPTFNRGYIVAKAVESVLNQTYAAIEVIVVDDGSTDDTREVLARFGSRIRYIHQPNAGLAAARNTGLAAARGEFIAFQDSDDLWAPWKLAAQIEVMRRHPSVGLTWTDMTAVDASGQVLRDRYLRTMYDSLGNVDLDRCMPRMGALRDVCADCPDEFAADAFRVGAISEAMFLGNIVHPPTAVMRRECIARIGGLDLSFAWACEDYEFFSRIAAIADCALVDAPGMLYRVEAIDQLTTPARMLFVARGNLEYIRRRLHPDAPPLKLPKQRIARHLAAAHAWVGAEELESLDGSRLRAFGHSVKSLMLNPLQGRTLAVALAAIALPGPLMELARSIKAWLRDTALGELSG